jgi:hypothetical protein
VTTDGTAAADGAYPPTVDEVFQFLAGSGAIGLWLAGLVRAVAGHPRGTLGSSSVWICLVGAAVFVWRGRDRPSRLERWAELATAAAFLLGAASFVVHSHTIQTLAQDLWLGVWGGLAAFRLQATMPPAMYRSGVAIGVATAGFGFLPGIWAWVAVGSVVAIVLVAVWVLDNLEAEGHVVKRREPSRE